MPECPKTVMFPECQHSVRSGLLNDAKFVLFMRIMQKFWPHVHAQKLMHKISDIPQMISDFKQSQMWGSCTKSCRNAAAGTSERLKTSQARSI